MATSSVIVDNVKNIARVEATMSNDTSPDIEKKVREMLMARSADERALMGASMFDAARAIVLSSFPPGLSDIEIARRLCERFYGDEVDVDAFVRAYAEWKKSHP